MTTEFKRPTTREPKWGFNRTLRSKHSFVGCVTTIYANFAAVKASGTVCPKWWEHQEIPPSTEDQVFYGCVSLDGVGAFLVGELDAKEA